MFIILFLLIPFFYTQGLPTDQILNIPEMIESHKPIPQRYIESSRSLIDHANTKTGTGRIENSRRDNGFKRDSHGFTASQRNKYSKERRPSFRRMRKASQSPSDVESPRKLRYGSKSIHRRVADNDHVVKTNEVIDQILDMLEPEETKTSKTLLYSPLDESTTPFKETQATVDEENESIFSVSTSAEYHETYNDEKTISKKDTLKEQKDQLRPLKVIKKVEITDEYHLDQKNVVMEPEMQSQNIETSSAFAATSEGVMVPTSEFYPYIPTSSIKDFSSESKVNNFMKEKVLVPPSISSKIEPVRNFKGTSFKDESYSPIHPQEKTYSSGHNLKYYPDLGESSKKPNVTSNKKDNALVLVLRLPELILREISQYVSYGIGPSEQELKPILEGTFSSVATSEIIYGNREKKVVGENLPTMSSDKSTTKLPDVHSNKSKNVFMKNFPNTTAQTFSNKSLDELNTISNSHKLELTSSVIKARDLEMENNINVTKLDDNSHVTTVGQTLPPTAKNAFVNNSKTDFFDALMEELSSAQDTSKSPIFQKDITGLQSDSLMTDANISDERGQRQAPSYQKEIIELFKTKIRDLVKRFEDRINGLRDKSNSEKDLIKKYMKGVLHYLVMKHKYDLIRELHKEVASKAKKV